MEDQISNREEKKKLYMREYMRKYKANKYTSDPEPIRRANRTRYLKRTTEISDEDKQKYGDYLADVVALRELIGRVPHHYIVELIEL